MYLKNLVSVALSREIVPVYVPGANLKMTLSVSSSASFVDTAEDNVRYGATSLPVSVYVSEDRFESTNTYASTWACAPAATALVTYASVAIAASDTVEPVARSQGLAVVYVEPSYVRSDRS